MYLEEGFVDDIREEVVKFLKSLGVKHVIKKADYKSQAEKRIEVYHVFKTSLELLEKEGVQIPQCSVQVEIPVFVIDCCNFIEHNLLIEGLFRKAGSTSKQRELRALLDCGNRLEFTDEHHVINVANILKLFFRELPEPLIPFKFHPTFLRCLTIKPKTVEALLLTCLLLPNDHLNTLAYLLMFLHKVSLRKDVNKMDIGNLAIIFTPSIMPLNAPKLTTQGSEKINHHVMIVQTLIENAASVGVLPETICDKLGYMSNSISSHGELDGSQLSTRKQRKKRSNSLTKMISGIKKIITKPDAFSQSEPFSPDPNTLYTPKVVSTRKRKPESQAFSIKKKCEVLNMLPGRVALANAPCTPHKIKFSSTTMLTPRTLITDVQRNCHQKGKKLSSRLQLKKSPNETEDRSLNSLKHRVSSNMMQPRNNEVFEESMELLNDKLETSYLKHQESPDKSMPEEYIRIRKDEYEAIKERVCQIENRLENELENILGVSISDYEDLNESKPGPYSDVENAYAKTIEESGKLSQSRTEQLTQKLSRDLRIRRNSEKIIRSPSARKIGSIRRRSRENVHIRKEINRQSSLNTCDRPRTLNNIFASKGLRRGRPNTVFTGLPQPSPLVGQSIHSNSHPNLELSAVDDLKMDIEQCVSNEEGNKWKSADMYLLNNKKQNIDIDGGRESVVKIRSQNVGMVLKKAKLFDNLVSDKMQIDNTNDSVSTSEPNKQFRKSLNNHDYSKIKLDEQNNFDYKINIRSAKIPTLRSTKSFNMTSCGQVMGNISTKSPNMNGERLHKVKCNQYMSTPSPKKMCKYTDNKQKSASINFNNITKRRSPRFNLQKSNNAAK